MKRNKIKRFSQGSGDIIPWSGGVDKDESPEVDSMRPRTSVLLRLDPELRSKGTSGESKFGSRNRNTGFQ